MRKPAFCICENKDAGQLRGNREADQRLCFRYLDSTIPLLPSSYIRNFKPLAILCGCTAWFVWGLVGNTEDRFSHNEAHLSHVMRKPEIRDKDQIRLKTASFKLHRFAKAEKFKLFMRYQFVHEI